MTPNRGGLTGGKGDSATITIIDTGISLKFAFDIVHKQNGEAGESAVECAVDTMMRSLGFPEWRKSMVGAEAAS